LKYDIPQTFYHIFDRANGDELLFKSDENYDFFLKKLKEYLSPYFVFYTYCLLPNHSHIVVRTKSIEELKKNELDIEKELFHKKCLQTCSNFLNSYAKSYNKYYSRKGSLFIERMKRVKLNAEQDIINAIFYVHKNPVHHGYVKELSDWCNCSYNSIISEREDEFAQPQSVLEIFGGKKEFKRVHEQFLYK